MLPPLAERMRPTTLDEYVGQEHLVGVKGALRKGLERKYLPSMILWGSPGIGKTTLALLLANALERPFFQLSAISSGVKDVRDTIEKAESQRFFSRPNPILFIDEIHRFNKAQQDALLGAVEKGTLTLIGATTENPSFEVISALLSRCQVYTLKPLETQQLISMLEKAISTDEILKNKTIELQETEAILRLSGGDGRKLYNILELVCSITESEKCVISDEKVMEVVQQNIAFYDKNGEQHYDIISAFIKSMRGSDPNAAVYYLACMLEGGEDIKFIARRMVILASEDIGLANPNALLLATTAFQAITQVGMPEARIILSQCAIYLATSPKSNASYMAIEKALSEVRKNGVSTVPLAIRNTPTSLMKDLGYGKGYQYAHDYTNNFANMEFLPENLVGKTFYEPSSNVAEDAIRQRLRAFWKEKYGY
jgi:putative ATPase